MKICNESIYSPIRYFIIDIDIPEVQYNVISKNFLCAHVGGEVPFYCFKRLSHLKSHFTRNCQDECTLFTNCIAYGEGNEFCYLFTSSQQCPNQWQKSFTNFSSFHNSEDVALSTTVNGYTCVLKGILESLAQTTNFISG